MILKAQWIAGFVDGEGCFFVGINAHKEMTAGFQVLPEFTVVQHQNDVRLLHALKEYFECGVVRKNHGDRMAFRVRGLDDFQSKIIPFFDRYILQSRKRQDYLVFRKIVKMMSRKDHLKPGGIQMIRTMARSMNRGRIR